MNCFLPLVHEALEKHLQAMVAAGRLTAEQAEAVREKRRAWVERQTRPPERRPVPTLSPPLTHGPGTELKKLLARIGIKATPNCSCNRRAREMDENEAKEPGWCEAHIDEIVGWLREEATKRKLPFVDTAGRLLVRRAIRNAKRAVS